MKNHVKPGKMITVVAAAVVASGDFVVQGALFGVAATSAAIGEEFELATGDVWELPKTSAQAWTLGQALYWDSGNKVVTSVSTDNTKIGVAAAIAPNPSGLGQVRLNDAF